MTAGSPCSHCRHAVAPAQTTTITIAAPAARGGSKKVTSAFIRQLQREIDADAGAAGPATPALQQRVLAWFESQPEISRIRPYSMVELERALGVPGRLLSSVLLSLGWERRRKWSSKGQSPRYWMPPDC
jgi:hypothetical protein